MAEYVHEGHSIYDIKYHIIWVTKYRYRILAKRIGERLGELLRQGCTARGITIAEGSIGKDHARMPVSCPPSIAVSKIVQCLKGCPSRLLQEEYGELRKRYCGQRLWARGYFCVTAGSVTKEMIQEYRANQFRKEGEGENNFKAEGDEFQS
jgi:putative transposase